MYCTQKSDFLFQHTFGELGPKSSLNLDVCVDCSETGDDGKVRWEEKIFGVEALARVVLHYCNGVICPRKSNKSGGTTWMEHFNPTLHSIDSSVSFVYIAYRQTLDRDGHPVVFGGKYQAKSCSSTEAKFVPRTWLKVVCGDSSTKWNFSIVTTFASIRGPMDCDIPDRVVGSLDKAAGIIFIDKNCRYVKLYKVVEAALKAEKRKHNGLP